MSPASEHLALWFERIRLIVQRYMRRYADRFDVEGVDTGYSDHVVGRRELRTLLGLDSPDAAAPSWLAVLGLPALEVIELRRVEREAHMHAWLTGLIESSDASALRLPIEDLRASFGLSALELELLLCAAAPRLSCSLARLYRAAWADFSVQQPTAGFLCELVAAGEADVAAALDCLSPERVLVRSGLLRLRSNAVWQPATPRLHALVEVPERICEVIRGSESLTPLPGCRLVVGGEQTLEWEYGEPGEHGATLREVMRESVRRSCARVQVLGTSGSGRRALCRSVLLAPGERLIEVHLATVARAAQSDQGREALLLAVARESRLQAAPVVVDLDGLDEELEAWLWRERAALVDGLASLELPVVTIATEPHRLADALLGAATVLRMPMVSQRSQRAVWLTELERCVAPRHAAVMADELARGYQLSPGVIRRCVAEVAAQRGGRRGGAVPTLEALVEQVRRQLGHGLGSMAELVATTMTLDEVVLDAAVLERVRELLRYARHAETVQLDWGFSSRGACWCLTTGERTASSSAQEKTDGGVGTRAAR